MNITKFLLEDLKATQVTPNGFSFFIKGDRLPGHVIFVIFTEDYVLFSAPFLTIGEMNADQFLAATSGSPLGVGIMGENYAVKHTVKLVNFDKERFMSELTFLIAYVEQFLLGELPENEL
jgi:hypothetical protein